MLCENCHKQEATFHFKEVVDDTVIALHLCSDCAAAKGIGADDEGLGLAKLIYNITAEALAQQTEPLSEELPAEDGQELLMCENCQWSAEDFKRHGRLGCPACYDAFRPMLMPLLKRMHRSTVHCGRTPDTDATAATAEDQGQKRAQLEEELARAIAAEAYERAAALRDQIEQAKDDSAEAGSK
jgi:protein arginine kinase activator